ncbi:MAG: NAD(P)-dependent oxidoreductase [Kiritimatiellia bacterium]|jgi:D-3-phosphoglycerate dehydrogenase|nr:NAD(P)-dependent oxidoreductase [Kiritimatiellia bacterium]MDP6811277.1 NAD(P)-dependent oxidoreductase [Kiritimatiellia bacterium]MDP7024109.1 NAD(P)-dependent oxidoreductase [Kiritimatiellia bacterium]
MKKVLIPTKLDGVAGEILEENGNYVVIQDEATELKDLVSAHSDTYALIVRSEKVTPEIIDLLPNLQVVVRAGAGFNTIDTVYARSKGIDVMNTPGANSNAVAEEVVAMILADARHLIPADASTRAGKWEKKKFMGRELANKTVGIVGLGNIGRLVARRISGFDCRLLGFDPVISSERAREVDVTLTDLQTIFTECDYITLHIPENDDTRGIINEELLSLAKEGATIVNCARAGILNENAFRKAKAGRGIRLLNDVYPKDAEGDKTVADIADIMLPHLGASTKEANFNAARRAAEELIDLDYKGVTSFIVNRDIPDGLDEAYCELANTLARLCRNIVGRQSALKMVETSFYGDLEPYANWLAVPIVAGIWEDFERGMDYHAAFNYLDEMGIEYVSREVDASKGYGNSITLDLTSEVDSDSLRRISVRGTLAEGNMMVARINEFDRLYFEPLGHTVFFLYDDRPGVIGVIGRALAESEVNIEDMRNPHDPNTNRSLAILKVNQRVPDAIIDAISQEINSIAAFHITL